MTQWQVGKTYQLIYPLAFVESDSYPNRRIYKEIGFRDTIKMMEVDSRGRVITIEVEGKVYHSTQLELIFFFKNEDLQYFKLVGDSPEANLSPNEVVIEWLDKLYYVMRNDDFVDNNLCARCAGLSVDTDADTVQGSDELYKFINERYQIVHEVNQKELQSKREQLLAELAEIDKQLNIK